MKSDWDILVDYVAGETPAEERPRVERWIREDPQRERLLAELRVLWDARTAEPDAEAGWSRLLAKMARAATASPARVPSSAAPRMWRSWMLRAAVLAAALLGGLAVLQRVTGPSRDPAAAWASARVFTTGHGELARIRLGDGSEVVLGVRSRLLVPADFGASARDVRLEGEAFFAVTADAARPFSVHAAGATVRVLGTEFGVRARDERETSIIVVGGTVRVTPAAGPGAELTAGQLGRVVAGAADVVVENGDPATHLAWMERRLVFQDAPLAEVLEHVALWYDFEFRIGDASLSARRLNASFERATLAELLHGIALAVNATYVVEGRTVTFVPRS